MLGVAAIAAIILLQQRAIPSDDREDALQQIKIEVNQLATSRSSPTTRPAATPSAPTASSGKGKRAIQEGLAELRRDDPPAVVAARQSSVGGASASSIPRRGTGTRRARPAARTAAAA